jgi:hypothetical protein
MREKLIELLGGVQSYGVKHTYEETASSMGFRENDEVADHLIANGVTIQKWIPVTERLPEKGVLVLCIGARGGMFLGRSPNLLSDGTAHFCVPNARSCRYATYWMPLPEPPNE